MIIGSRQLLQATRYGRPRQDDEAILEQDSSGTGRQAALCKDAAMPVTHPYSARQSIQ
jgi:hypothetical protein